MRGGVGGGVEKESVCSGRGRERWKRGVKRRGR